MPKPKKKQLPPTLYMTIEHEEKAEDSYILTYESVDEMDEAADGQTVGIYELVETRTLKVGKTLV